MKGELNDAKKNSHKLLVFHSLWKSVLFASRSRHFQDLILAGLALQKIMLMSYLVSGSVFAIIAF